MSSSSLSSSSTSTYNNNNNNNDTLLSIMYVDSAMPLHTISDTLRESTVAPSTLDSYEIGVNAFLHFCSAHKLIGSSVQEIDYYLNRYMESLYQNKIPNGKQIAADTLFGIIRRYPHTKLSFPLSRQSLKGFQKLIPSISHTPLTYYTCIAMASVLSKSGYLDRAVALLLMFHCYLRISEMINLYISDIALPTENRFGSNNIISELRIAKAKTGRNQSVSITDSHIHILLQTIIGNRLPTERLFLFSQSVFSRSFHSSIRVLGISENIFVPHSCRHGGATYDHIKGMSIEQILLRGRWKSNDSARTYIQSLRAVTLTTVIPQHVHTMGEAFSNNLSEHILNLYALSQM